MGFRRFRVDEPVPGLQKSIQPESGIYFDSPSVARVRTRAKRKRLRVVYRTICILARLDTNYQVYISPENGIPHYIFRSTHP